MKYFLFILLLPFALHADIIPRKVISFWDSYTNRLIEDSIVHLVLEMPLNHLGMDIEYYDIHKPLPDLSQRKDVRGILICFETTTKMQDPKSFIQWAVNAIDLGKKVVIMGNPGFISDLNGMYTSIETQNKLFEKIGLINNQKSIDYPFEYTIVSKDNSYINFEGPYPHPLPPFTKTNITLPNAISHLKIAIAGRPESTADLIITTPFGGYVSEFYANNFDRINYTSNPRDQKWYLNPFRFFEEVFQTTHLPVPDVTTLAGKRIFYATCHGDSWNIATTIANYKKKKFSCAQVILEEVIKPYPDIPVSVAVIAADVDPNWVGKTNSQEVARQYFSLPQIETASHTYSHPFDWQFFKMGGPEKEIDFLPLYPYGSWKESFLSWFRSKNYHLSDDTGPQLKKGYIVPRAYANEPFDVTKEITGSVDFLNQFAPKEKPIELLIWSGDCLPWSDPVLLCQKAGIKNFGGGFVRFDAEYPSHIFIYPLGRKPGGVVQLYDSAAGDNNYTNNWKDQFYGFKFLPQTLKNTDVPKRLRPIFLYYHSYSGQFTASIEALLNNIQFIKSQNPIAIFVSRFCDIGEGFYSTQIEPLQFGRWKILNRKGLQTIRFDNAEKLSVDFSKSQGVIGYRMYQKSLYVYLDAHVQEPIIATMQNQNRDIAYLIESSWEIWNLKREKHLLSCNTKGFGPLITSWWVPEDNRYEIKTGSQIITVEAKNHILEFTLDLPFHHQAQLIISKAGLSP